MLGDYNGFQPKLYTEKIAGGVKACVGFVKDRGAGRYVPNTVLEGDIRQKVKSPDRIILTYRKIEGGRANILKLYIRQRRWNGLKSNDQNNMSIFRFLFHSSIVSSQKICKGKDILKECLSNREKEVLSIMMTLFDKKEIQEQLGNARYHEGRREEKIDMARSLADMGMTIDQIAKAAKVSVEVIKSWLTPSVAK